MALVIIVRVDDICKDGFDIMILVVVMLQWVSFANSKDVVVVVIIVRVGVICKDVLGRGWQTDSALLVLTNVRHGKCGKQTNVKKFAKTL